MDHTRRRLVRYGAAAVSLAFAKPAFAALPPRREVHVYNIHTGEKFAGTYWSGGSYRRDALKAIRTVLRDFRTGAQHDIDPKLLDLLTVLRGEIGASDPFHVISGYRSPQTNAMLHRSSSGVATHSLHMVGQAIDIRLPNCALSTLHKAALGLKAGGVGYYPRSDFVHVDVGRVRHW